MTDPSMFPLFTFLAGFAGGVLVATTLIFLVRILQ